MSKKEIPEIKIILLGDSAVGKTSIIKRFNENTFNADEASSVTMSHVDQIVNINNKKYKLNIWDTIGQEQYRSISKLFLNGTKIAILVYSIENKKSFESLNYWFSICKDEFGDDIILGVCGNKIDRYLDQEVPSEEGRNFANDKNALFVEVSAKEDKIFIKKFFLSLVEMYADKTTNFLRNKENTRIKLEQENDSSNSNDKNKKDKRCCSSKK